MTTSLDSLCISFCTAHDLHLQKEVAAQRIIGSSLVAQRRTLILNEMEFDDVLTNQPVVIDNVRQSPSLGYSKTAFHVHFLAGFGDNKGRFRG